MRNFIQFNSTGIINFELPVRPVPTQVTASIYNSNGSLLASNDAGAGVTLATVVAGSLNSLLYQSASAGANSLVIENPATSLTKGKHYLVGVSEAQNGEMVTVKNTSVAGPLTTINLMRPLIYSHETTEYISDTEVKVTVPASVTSNVSQNNYIKLAFTGSVSGLSEDAIHKSFDITRFIPVTTLSIEDLRDFDSQIGKKGLAGLQINSLMKKAWEVILARVGARGNMGGIVGSVDMTIPHSYLTRRMIAELDPEQKEYSDMLALRFNEEFEAIASVTPMDKNGDGNIQDFERFRNTISWVRT